MPGIALGVSHRWLHTHSGSLGAPGGGPMIFAWGTLILLGAILAAIPIGFALGLAGIGSLAMLVPVQTILALMAKVVHATSASYVILTIPMFVLLAEFLGCGGIAQD